jgi:hypothetical protein
MTDVVINGHRMPEAGVGAILLWKALRNVLDKPGISSGELHRDIAAFSHDSHPEFSIPFNGRFGPSGKLWHAAREPAIKLYPNEWTQQAFDVCPHPDAVLLELMKIEALNLWGSRASGLKPGDLVNFIDLTAGEESHPAPFVSWVVADIDLKSWTAGGCREKRRVAEFATFDKIVTIHETTPTFPAFANGTPKYSVQRWISMNVFFEGRFKELGWWQTRI